VAETSDDRNARQRGPDTAPRNGRAGGQDQPQNQAQDQRFARELALHDRQPPKDTDAIWRNAAQFSTTGLFVIAFIVALYLARPVLMPTVAAFVIGFMLGPLSAWARRLGIPAVLTAILLWLAVVVVFYGILAILSAPAVEWIARAPDIGAAIKEKLHLLDRPLAALKDLRDAVLPEGEKAGLGVDLAAFLQTAFGLATPAVGQFLIFFGALFFVLLGRTQMRQVMVFFFSERDARLRMLKILNDVEYNLTTYLSVVAAINCVVGVAAAIIAWAVGLPSPLALGLLAIILNFIPYVGPLIMELVLLALGIVTFASFAHALIAPGLFLLFTTAEGHFITPAIMGRRLTLNPLTVFLALIFWTWLWGPVGAFLAVPLLIVALVTFNHLVPDDDAVLPG